QIRRASSVDHRTDLYALGLVFYNAITGTRAFERESTSDVLAAICLEPLPSPELLAPGLPERVGAWFRKACQRNPDDRFQSASELLEALFLAIDPELLESALNGGASSYLPPMTRPSQAPISSDACPTSTETELGASLEALELATRDPSTAPASAGSNSE